MMAIFTPAFTPHIPWHEHDGDYHSCFYFTHSMAWAWWRLSLLLLLHTFHGINMMAIITPAFTPHIPWHEHDGDYHSCFYFTHSMAWAWWRFSLLLLLHTFHGMSMMAIITPASTSHIPWHEHDGDYHSCFYFTHSMAWAWWRLPLLLLLHTFHGMSMWWWQTYSSLSDIYICSISAIVMGVITHPSCLTLTLIDQLQTTTPISDVVKARRAQKCSLKTSHFISFYFILIQIIHINMTTHHRKSFNHPSS